MKSLFVLYKRENIFKIARIDNEYTLTYNVTIFISSSPYNLDGVAESIRIYQNK